MLQQRHSPLFSFHLRFICFIYLFFLLRNVSLLLLFSFSKPTLYWIYLLVSFLNWEKNTEKKVPNNYVDGNKTKWQRIFLYRIFFFGGKASFFKRSLGWNVSHENFMLRDQHKYASNGVYFAIFCCITKRPGQHRFIVGVIHYRAAFERREIVCKCLEDRVACIWDCF